MIKCSIGVRAVVALLSGSVVTAAQAGDPISFNRDVRPILSNNCFMCHGPDHGQRKANLRLDMQTDALAPHKHGVPLTPGDLQHSQIYLRITSTDPDRQMPPPDSGKKITRAQINTLKRWIEQGGEYQKLWSFIAPVRSELPSVKNAGWCRNPIDRFILARLEQEGLSPSPEADKATLVRRLSLDLLGLPPTLEEVDQFVNDKAPDAYEKLVDRLLANPHFGERLALDWLDAARYADTHGYHIDSGRDQTRWREWVIDAFNKDKPFDQFTIEQLAGDLLPNATLEQKIATGFVRNNMINFEGGAIPQEYQTAYIIDRVNTTSMVWLGLTVNCCQCHDHKYDPLTQKDYYQLYAYFNNVPENGLDGNKGNAVPLLAAPTKEEQARLDEIATKTRQDEEALAAPNAQADAEQAVWEKTATDSRVDWTTLEPTKMQSKAGATLSTSADKSILVTGSNPPADVYTLVTATPTGDLTALRLETLPDEKLSAGGPGRSANGNFVLTDVRVTTGAQNTGAVVKLQSASADFSQATYPVANAIDADPQTGWAIYPAVGKSHSAVFRFDQPIHCDSSTGLTVTLSFQSQFSQHQLGHFRIAVTSAKNPLGIDSMPGPVRAILSIAADSRNAAQRDELKQYFRKNVCTAFKKVNEELASLSEENNKIVQREPTTMVMAELPKPRDTFILVRGQYDKPGERVTANTPAALPPQAPDSPANRLGLARWIVSPQQPLTSRVIVNRFWQSFFGTGIVKTVEDFGSQGEEPSHPELLDWLAVEFANPSDAKTPRWDVKALIKQIVMSATYRQSSVATPQLLARDPESRLLARQSRIRLSAEAIRDQALAVSGLLNDQIGGRSVSPYQPSGLWSELMSRSDGANWTAQVYVQDHGKDLYRRSMYTFWKRTSPPPSLSAFDAPDRETCTVRRSRTNTPLQALVLENDPTYVEASRKLAERIMKQGGGETDERIAYGFELTTARLPTVAESRVLHQIFDAQLAVYQHDSEGARKLLSVGESPRDSRLDTAQLAAWTTVASVILNLDETITKG